MIHLLILRFVYRPRTCTLDLDGYSLCKLDHKLETGRHANSHSDHHRLLDPFISMALHLPCH